VDVLTDREEELRRHLERAEEQARNFRTREGLGSARAALAAARLLRDRAAIAKALAIATRCHYYRGDYDAALATGIDTLEAFDPDDRAGRADALQNIALVLFAIEDFVHAEDAAARAVAEAARCGDPLREAAARNVSGYIFSDDGRLAEARREFRRAARIYRHMGDTLMAHKVASNLGHTYRKEAERKTAREDAAGAHRSWRHALRVYRVAVDADRTHANDAIALGCMGLCQFMLGRESEARRLLERCLAMANGAAAIVSPAALWSCRVAESMGDLDLAQRHAAEAVRAGEGLEHGEHYVTCLRAQARIAGLQGRADEQRRLEERADQAAAERRRALSAAREQAAPLWRRFRDAVR
jgi:tetratricopeptide (TPR) repeat protein